MRRKLQNRRKLIARYHAKAAQAGIWEVERLAREILRQNPTFREFVMGMGDWVFWDTDDNQVDPDDPRVKKLCELITEWDPFLRLTGTPMRFTAEGDVVREW